MTARYVVGAGAVIAGILIIVFRRKLEEPSDFWGFRRSARSARVSRPVILFAGLVLVVFGTLMLAGVIETGT